MRRARILTGGVVSLILVVGVGLLPHPSSPSMPHESADRKQLWSDRASLLGQIGPDLQIRINQSQPATLAEARNE
jgi:hypothetical protein